jgi:spermidine synthase
MQSNVVLERVPTPDGRTLSLEQRGDVFTIRLDHVALMSSRASGSETALARLGCADLGTRTAPRVLVGGLGMGFTLRAVLHELRTRRDARVVVVELLPPIVRWNRTQLGGLAAHPLDDPRVELVEGDVRAVLAATPAAFDLVLLDVDNGPAALTSAANRRLYTADGLAAMRKALRKGGVVAVWSAGPDARFAERLRRAGFAAEMHQVRAGPGDKGSRYVVFVGRAR